MNFTREAVLELLGGRSRPTLNEKALLRELGGRRAKAGSLRPILQSLVREGKLERVGNGYRLPRNDGLIEGTYQGSGEARPVRTRRGGVEPRAGLHSADLVRDDAGGAWSVGSGGGAEPGDRVLLRPVGDPGARRGEIVHVLGGGERRQWIGILSRERHGGLVTPYRDDAQWGISIAATDLGGARDGDVVQVAPARRGGGKGAPRASGRIVSVYGPPGHPEADFAAVTWRRRLPVDFPPRVLAEAEEIEIEASPEELARRVDLRSRPFATIDPATARDHDDAVCIEPLSAGATRLWVAIADVAHYVAEGSALDLEALRRGNSVYFPDRAIPMLPHRLSGEICSLYPQVDRLAMIVELELSATGGLERRSFYPGVIRSRARLTYEQAAAVMEGCGDGGIADAEIRDQLRGLAALAGTLTERRFAAGSIDFDLPTAEIVLGDDGHPVDIVEAPRTLAHRAIEECMLVANRAVADALSAAKLPALYRIHEPPEPDKIELLCELLAAFGLLESRNAQSLSAREIARAVQRVAGRPEERLVNLVALRSMRQARYDETNRGHFALAFDSYTHFTSPIRRYADLVVHRALKDLLEAGGLAASRAAARESRVAGIAARVSWRERVAMEAEREMIDLKKCAFMAGRVGDEYDGTITGVAKHGFYVTLDPFFVEGLVHVSRLPDYVVLDERAHALVSRRSRERWRLGDRLRVRVDDVDPVKAWINFSVVERLSGGTSAPPAATPRAYPRTSSRASSSAARRSHSR
ncbi:MAG TPA: ribonuclease R [Myxococcota bacterium]|nr:ribonuclease R [Myxococcota bacterium]